MRLKITREAPFDHNEEYDREEWGGAAQNEAYDINECCAG